MVRKQVYIRRDQDERLKAAAAATGRTESDLIREAVGHTVRADRVADPPRQFTVAETAKHEEEREHNIRRRGWRREDLYWDRMTLIQRAEAADRAWIRELLRSLPAPATSATSGRPPFKREEAYAERIRRLPR